MGQSADATLFYGLAFTDEPREFDRFARRGRVAGGRGVNGCLELVDGGGTHVGHYESSGWDLHQQSSQWSGMSSEAPKFHETIR